MDALLDRDGELEALAAGTERAREGEGSVVLVEAPAGGGKSALLAAARARAAADGVRVLQARGAVLEREFAFGVARQLFEPALAPLGPDERAGLLAGAASLAGPLLDGADPARTAPQGAGAFGALHALYWLTVNLADRGPLLVSVDDAHWADRSSLEFLAYLSRRLAHLPVLVALAARPRDAEDAAAGWTDLAHDPATVVVRPRPLSAPAVAAIVRARLGAGADDAFGAACHRATGGNPLYVRELVGALADAGVEPTAAAADAVDTVGPAAVTRFVLHRLERLGPDATALAQAVAVLGDDVDPAIAARLAQLTPEAAEAAAARLVRADVLRAGRDLAFGHPIVRAAVYEDLLPQGRRVRHRTAAELLEQAGAAPERVAAHVLESGPAGDGRWSGVLHAAAQDAALRGDPGAASAYLRRALDETPDEPRRAELLTDLGRWTIATGRHDLAARDLLEALRLEAAPATRAAAATWLAWAAITAGDPRAAAAALEAIDAELPALDPPAALDLEAAAVDLVRLEPTLRALAADRVAGFAAHAAGHPHHERLARLHAASEEIVRGGPVAPAADATEALLADGPPGDPVVFGLAIELLIGGERHAAAARWLELALQAVRAQGLAPQLASLLAQRALLALAQGRVGAAQLDAQTALELADARHVMRPRIAAAAIHAALERGELDAARRLAGDHAAAAAERERLFADELLTARGRLRIRDGDVAGGLADLLRCGELQAAYGDRRPGDWRAEAVAALVALGELDRARGLAAEGLERARAHGASRVVARALRAAGVAEGGEPGLALLEEAVTTAQRSPARLEAANALADLGGALVRARRRREGREVLRLALEEAQRCGAVALADRVHGELGAGGGRPPRLHRRGVDALTPAERRVCELAARELTNREVAQTLFVTEKTVELHLTSAYRKLGIRSRFQLASALNVAAEPG